jgi:hypothetical protein
MNMSIDTTEIQHNQFTNNSEKHIQITNSKGQVKSISISPQSKAIRYLGIWMNASLTTNWGLEILKEKINNRIKEISNIKGTIRTKATLMKSRVISLINFTSGVVTIDQNTLELWDKEMTKAICGWESGMLTLRRDIAFLPVQKGGLGIRSIQEEYQVNRARVIGNIMEAGERIEGRGQLAWAKRLMQEELNNNASNNAVIQEIQILLDKLNLKLIKHTDYPSLQKPNWTGQWKTKTNLKMPYIPKVQYLTGRYMTKVGKAQTINTVIEGLNSMGKTDEEVGELLQLRQTIRSQICEEREWHLNRGVVLGKEIMTQLAKQMQGKWGELIITWEDMEGLIWIPKENWKKHIQENNIKGLVINETTPCILRNEIWYTSEIKQVIQLCDEMHIPVIYIIGKDHNNPEGTDWRQLADTLAQELVKPAWGTSGIATTIINEPVEIWVRCQQEDKQINILEKILQTFGETKYEGIHNMYIEKPEEFNKTWTCPMCQQKGQRINEYYGVCKKVSCVGVTTEQSTQDSHTGGKKVRRVETLLLKPQPIIQTPTVHTRVKQFYTDGSGTVVNKETGLMHTGWGIVQVYNTLIDKKY